LKHFNKLTEKLERQDNIMPKTVLSTE
jgi:hypothetical protein